MRQYRSRLALTWALLFVLAASGLLVVEFGLLRPGAASFLLLLLAALCILPGASAWLRGRFDPFEPAYPVAVATLIYFGVIVVMIHSTGRFSMLGIDYGEQVPTTIFLALLALAGFDVAYYGATPRLGQAPREPVSTVAVRAAIHRYAAALLVLFSAMFVLWVIIARTPIRSLWVFGSASYGAWNVEASGAKLGHLFAAQEALPACVLLLIASRARRRWPVSAWLILGAIIVLYAGIGVRARLLLVCGGAAAFFYLERGKRPTARQLGAMALVVFFLIIGAVGHYRNPGSEAAAPYRLLDAWDRFVEGSDIVTTSALYVRWVPVCGYDWGRVFFQVLLAPIPSALWPGKYLFLGRSPIQGYEAVGAAAAFFIEFYRSFGPAAVVFGMALIGSLSRKVYNTYRAEPGELFAQVAVALLWAYLFHSPMLLAAARAAHRVGVPVVTQPHGTLPVLISSFWAKRLYDRVLGSAELSGVGALVVLQERERHQALARGVPAERIEIIPNGIDPHGRESLPPPGAFRERWALKPDRPLILFLGRINKIKGADMLVEAFAQLKRRDAQLVIAGPDDGQLAAVQARIREHDLTGRVVLPGTLSGADGLAAFRDADLFALPCRSDAFPVTIMEACLAGTPMVITNRCEIADLVRDQVAEVVPFDAAAFAAAMDRLLTDRGLQARYRANCEAMLADTFSIEAVVDRLEAVYRRVIAERAGE